MQLVQHQHLEMADHIAKLRTLKKSQKQQIDAMKKELHELDLAQAMLVNVAEERRPDLQNALNKLLLENE